ncbi:MAG: DUF3597 domain-containing protein [Xanthobacteraceae bacterium]
MSIFGKIMSSIFGKAEASTTAGPGAPASPGAPEPPPLGRSGAASGTTQSGTSPTSPGTQVDVSAVLTKLASENKEKLDWRHSIVDLMKLLNLDSSLSARKELAKELNYSGDMNDSASMNMWLHKQVMQKLAENGGKVPEELKS